MIEIKVIREEDFQEESRIEGARQEEEIREVIEDIESIKSIKYVIEGLFGDFGDLILFLEEI